MKPFHYVIITLLVLLASCAKEDTVYVSSGDVRVKYHSVKPYAYATLADGSFVGLWDTDTLGNHTVAKLYGDGSIDSVSVSLVDVKGRKYAANMCVDYNNNVFIYFCSEVESQKYCYLLVCLDEKLNIRYHVSTIVDRPMTVFSLGNTLQDGRFAFFTKDDTGYLLYVIDEQGRYAGDIRIEDDGHLAHATEFFCTGESIVIMYQDSNWQTALDVVSLGGKYINTIHLSPEVNAASNSIKCFGRYFYFLNIQYSASKNVVIDKYDSRGNLVFESDTIHLYTVTSLNVVNDNMIVTGYDMKFNKQYYTVENYYGKIARLSNQDGSVKDSVTVDYDVKIYGVSSDGLKGYNVFLERKFDYGTDYFNSTKIDNIYIYNTDDLNTIAIQP